MDIHNKYRPKTFDELIGQDHIVSSLKAYDKSFPHTYLLIGSKGLGKTSTARIIASEVDCTEEDGNLFEVDAGTVTHKADITEFAETWRYPAMGKKRNKFVIIDEAHGLSKASWNSLLHITDEPPEHLYIAFTTTEAQRIPDTIHSRCKSYVFKPVDEDTLIDYLSIIAETEEIKLSEKELSLVAYCSEGSVRQALSNLDKVRGAVGDEKTLRDLLSFPEAPIQLIDFMQKLAKMSATWKDFTNFAKNKELFTDSNVEAFRIQIIRYFNTVVLNNTKNIPYFLSILSAFSKPMYNKTDFILAVGELFYETE